METQTLTPKPEMKIGALAGWFGANRMLPEVVGKQLGKLLWCGVPFAGGCPELPYIECKAGVASDLHRHLINLARVVSDLALSTELQDQLDTVLFHEDELAAAQHRCRSREQAGGLFVSQHDYLTAEADVGWARDYFVCCWMSRGGNAGKRAEFQQSLAVRWSTTGGDSARRFRSAVESLQAWAQTFHGVWSFVRKDVFEFLGQAKNLKGHGLYLDPPWVEVGHDYAHTFTEDQHRRLAKKLRGFDQCRVVVRYGDHPLVRELYKGWTVIEQLSVNQQGNDVREVLFVNGQAFE